MMTSEAHKEMKQKMMKEMMQKMNEQEQIAKDLLEKKYLQARW